MSDTSERVECGTHGTRPSTFVCQHLMAGAGQGFYSSAEQEDLVDLWPDAWCAGCETVRAAEGGWNERSESVAGIQLLCSDCYEVARERNWIEDQDAFATLVGESVAYLERKQSEIQELFQLNTWERYDWDQESGELVFSHGGQPRVVADIQFVGSLSTHTNTWMWAWANDSLRKTLTRGVREVRAYGEEHSFHKLAAAHWGGTEDDGWEMTAIAAALLTAQGAYRSPKDRGFTFMVITGVRWAQ